jgi:hypothetical protein
LRSRGIVTTQRQQNWIIYSLPKTRAAELERNLKCLQDCVQTDPVFSGDLARLKKLQRSCCQPSELFERIKRERKTNARKKSIVHLRAK